MAISTRNARKVWSVADERMVSALARKNTPTGVMCIKLGRSEDAIRAKAQELKVSLKPVNQKPYNRLKK